MQCELCGKETRLFRARIEGTVLNVCKECSSYGELLKEPPRAAHGTAPRVFNTVQYPARPKRPSEVVIANPGPRIRARREQLGLKQEEFAKKINEKESLIHKIETGHFTPSIALAKKIGRFLGLKLVEEMEEEAPVPEPSSHSNGRGFTLGDIVKLKK